MLLKPSEKLQFNERPIQGTGGITKHLYSDRKTNRFAKTGNNVGPAYRSSTAIHSDRNACCASRRSAVIRSALYMAYTAPPAAQMIVITQNAPPMALP